MSRAFVKEDIDPPERSRRPRSASGLPPGATNYMTAAGAMRLRGQLEKLRRTGNNAEGVSDIETILASVTIVEPPVDSAEDVIFGASVTVRDATGEEKTYRVVGVDELDFFPDAVSWISPIGRALLAAELNQQVTLPETGTVRIVKVEYPTD